MTPGDWFAFLNEAAEDARACGDHALADLLQERAAIEDRELGERYSLPLDEGARAEFDSVDEWMRWRGR
jgi:hypothetical protein